MATDSRTIRRRFDLRGQVQGVGFRPYVYRLAAAHGVAGHVANNSNGAVIEAEATPTTLAAFERDLLAQLPPLARVTEFVRRELEPIGETAFRIRASQDDAGVRPVVTPDAATCADCLRELRNPHDRRYRYAFINCTNCGPRYSIIRDVPYDRPQTTMSVFEMCPPCAREYHDPADRRFHAQPNACPSCGPALRLEAPQTGDHELRTQHSDPIRAAAQLLRDGGILAVKGIGGYHLACRADREDVAARLRERKLRDGKPLAVMVPDLAAAGRLCALGPADEAALTSTAAPIVLARKAENHGLAPSIAPGCRDFGVLLPYAPLHHLLFAEGLGPLVMTSANLAGQPLTYRDADARATLSDVADAFLMHDREIFRPIDDSVVFTFRDDAIPIRRARGFAPRPLRSQVSTLPRSRTARILAVGGELKATVCLWRDGEAVVSEHLGDLTHPEAFRHFVQAIDRLKQLYAFEPEVVACDLHPRYLSTEYAQRLGLPIVAVQHHHAHIASVMAESGAAGPLVGLACDGTGYGPDHAVWGCEVLVCHQGACERAGHLEYFPLAGGDAAAVETWRPAAALLRVAVGDDWRSHFPSVDARDVEIVDQQIRRGINAPATSSLGRVFDGVAYLLGLCSRNRHEAEAAMAVEAAASCAREPALPFEYVARTDGAGVTLSLWPTVRELVQARDDGAATVDIAARFHETVAGLLVDAATLVARARRIDEVALSGGCFANRLLLGRVVELLAARGLKVLYHRSVPSGDGGLSLGQAFVAAWSR